MRRSRAPQTLIIATLALAMLLAIPVTAHAITRAEIISRALHWVDIQVPYSQTSYFEGYRTDCSGMASMAWKLPTSHSTRTLVASGYLVPVSREQLQPGDMLNKYDYHAAIFYKWADSAHTHYWTLEESGGAGHAVMRLTPYPYWSQEGFGAYRHRDIYEVNDYTWYVRQIAGANRYDTALAASQLVFPSDITTHAIVCSGENWPDALGSSALAGTLDAPILLVGADHVPPGVANELSRLGADNVIVIGGEAAVSPGVAQSLAAVPGVSVARIGGANRYETAALVALEVDRLQPEWEPSLDDTSSVEPTPTPTAYIATGVSFPDALGAAAVAANTGRPILLSEPGLLPAVTAEALRTMETSRALITGGYAALEQTVTAQLERLGIDSVERFAGADRYETSWLIALEGVEAGVGGDYPTIATGENFADALAGAAMQAQRGSGLVLTRPDRLSIAGDWAIRTNLYSTQHAWVLGGTAAVGHTPRRQARWILDEP